MNNRHRGLIGADECSRQVAGFSQPLVLLSGSCWFYKPPMEMQLMLKTSRLGVFPDTTTTARPDRSESGFPKASEGASLTH